MKCTFTLHDLANRVKEFWYAGLGGNTQMKKSELLEKIKERGWAKRPDTFMTFYLGDRYVNFNVTFNALPVNYAFGQSFSISTPEFDEAVTSVRNMKEKEFPIVNTGFGIRNFVPTDENIDKVLQSGIDWGRSIDIDAEIEKNTKIPRTNIHQGPIRLLSSLALLRRSDDLRNILRDFEEDHTRFAANMEKDMIERAIDFAQRDI